MVILNINSIICVILIALDLRAIIADNICMKNDYKQIKTSLKLLDGRLQFNGSDSRLRWYGT
jgi:hypothetical protein